MGKRTNLGWVVYGQDIDQPKLVTFINLFLSVSKIIRVGIYHIGTPTVQIIEGHGRLAEKEFFLYTKN